jgi:hypothetical protein
LLNQSLLNSKLTPAVISITKLWMMIYTLLHQVIIAHLLVPFVTGKVAQVISFQQQFAKAGP